MKKTITFFRSMLLAVILLMGSVSMWSATVIYTISAKNTLTTTGTAPSGSSASMVETFSTTQQMPSGNSQTLTLSGYSGYKISSITLSMKSNVSAGSGNFIYKIDGGTENTIIATAKFNTISWYSAWSSAYINVVKAVNITCGTTSTVLKIAATVNSLYCQSYSLTYEALSTCTPPITSFTSSSISKITTDAAFTNVYTSNNTSTKVWSSSNEAVATVDAAGEVTIHSAGITSIKVNQAADATYCAVVDAGYTLNVTAPVVPEPTNHATAFTATANSTSQIALTWTDATGAQLPDGYLVKASTAGTPTAPTDGIPETDEILVKNITQGTQTAVFTGLNASTTYNFSICPYTNNGAAIDYKTDGVVPTTNATTATPLGIPVATAATDISATGFTTNWSAAASATGYELSVYTKTAGTTASDLFISEYIEGSSNNKYIEIFNGTGTTVDLSDYKLQLYTNGSTSLTSDVVLSGTLGNRATVVYKNNNSSLTLPSGISAASNAAVNYNGDDAVALYKISTSSFVDIFGRIGEDPGSSWGTSPLITLDKTLVRKSSVTGGITINPSSGFPTLATEWDSYNTDVTTYLGSHTMTGSSSTTPISGSPFAITGTTKVVSSLNPGTEYFYTVVAKNGTESSTASNEIRVTTTNIIVVTGVVNASTLADCPTCNVSIADGGHLTIDAAKTYNSITVAPQGKLTNSSTLTVSAITIQSDANGTGTIIGDVTGAATVNQYLPSYRTWYLSSPVSNAQPTGMNWIETYNETDDSWPTLFDARPESLVAFGTNSFETGKGYLVVPVSGNSIQFIGALNNGDQNLTLTRSAGNTLKPGFNLIGNPYPSYLDWSKVLDANSSRMPTSTMWYRTKEGSTYKFWTVNGDGVSSPNGASQYIPPMQAFWVRTNATYSNFTLSNDMRSHAPASDYLLKVPSTENTGNALIRLQVSNGTNTDEAVIYFSNKASDGLDANDSPKMSNDNPAIPEIFTSINNEQMVINGMNSIPLNQEITLGFNAGNATSFSIKANELSNLPSNVKVILKDNVTNAETDLTDGKTSYQFTPIATTADRFSIIFHTAGVTTGLENSNSDGILVYSNAMNKLTVSCKAAINAHTIVSVFNAVGQRLVSQATTGSITVIDKTFTPGIYVVKVNNVTTKVVVK